jgi:AcrR family transcriptional regulator
MAGAPSGSGVPEGVSGTDHDQRRRGRRGHRVPVGGDVAAAAGRVPSGTRERILDVALDLFVDQGFDKTSLREVAERLGVTKAALYYHFKSKDDILFTLHLPVHDLVRRAAEQLTDPASRASWVTFLDWLIDEIAANSRLLLLYQRNAAAFKAVHTKDHGWDEAEPEQFIRTMLGNPALSLDDRVRIAGALAVVVSGAATAALPSGKAADPEELAGIVRAAVRDLLRTGVEPKSP